MNISYRYYFIMYMCNSMHHDLCNIGAGL